MRDESECLMCKPSCANRGQNPNDRELRSMKLTGEWPTDECAWC